MVVAPLAAVAVAGAAVVFHLHDARIDEASGIAVGVRSPGVVYVQNDSGDTNRVFALNARTGATEAVVTITGAVNHDWEDIATAPDADGTPSLWIADIGDNDSTRDEVDVYRVDEPSIHDGDNVSTALADEWRVRYPAGPADAESLAVTPDGTPYVITKSPLGHSVVYRLPRTPDRDAVRTAVRVGAITFDSTDTVNPFGVLGELAATGATISPDGRLLAVRTYSDVWLWHVRSSDIVAALRTRPAHLPLPDQRQGEGIAFDGDTLLLDSEGRGTPVWRVPLTGGQPASPAAAASTPTPTPTPTTATPAPHRDGPHLPSRRVWAIAVLATLVVAGAAGRFAQRRRRR